MNDDLNIIFFEYRPRVFIIDTLFKLFLMEAEIHPVQRTALRIVVMEVEKVAITAYTRHPDQPLRQSLQHCRPKVRI